ncbi:UNVERIFIED_CONTAM: hypothetical protein Slati_3928200 [Sesamum latifolium]|uniref:Reverse transcriptase domain-containing protein n=1 Tax=Sesamum latifolium TaxID=2727402 RepID=A0AAW2TPK9_9LAMI
MKRQTTLIISCGRVSKVKAQTMIFTQLQPDDKDDRKSIASSNYISNGAEKDIDQVYHVTLIEDSEVEEEDAEDAPVEIEEDVKATVNELKEVNLSNVEGASLTREEEETYIAWLHEFKDVFAWTYKEIRPNGEVNKLIKVGFIREVKYPMWISSIVPIRKKNGQIRGFILHGWIIRIQPNTYGTGDEELIAFCTPKGIYCYKVMPFGLKNAGATYLRVMQRIFDDMIHKNVECYIDDLVVKLKKREDHLHDLRNVFEHLRRYQLKMNPSKCVFGVIFGKFLGFIIRQRGIEIEQTKIDAILRMPEPRNIHELKRLQEKLAYL